MKGWDCFYTMPQTLHGPLAWQGRLRQHWVGLGSGACERTSLTRQVRIGSNIRMTLWFLLFESACEINAYVVLSVYSANSPMDI
jgi:hypothetical protein